MKYEISGILATLVAALGCGEAGGFTGTVSDSAGVTVVENGTDGLWGPADAWTVGEILRIGTAAGDPDYQFGSIASIAVGADGRIFVLDQQAQHVKVFDATGGYLSTFGGPGGGPGELGPGVTAMVHGPGDTLVVPDVAQQRVSLFREDGTFLSSFALTFESGIPLRWETGRAGRLVGQFRPLNLPNMPGAADSMDAVVERLADGTVTDTLLRLESGRTFSVSSGVPEFHFFSSEPIWTTLSDGRLAYGRNEAYRITMFDTAGSPAAIFTYPHTPEPVTEDDRQMITEMLERAWADQDVPAQFLEQLRRGVSFAEFVPAFSQMLGGPDGSVWVQGFRSPGASGDAETFNPLNDLGSTDWAVFDSGGYYLGEVQTPPRFAPRLFVGDHLYGVWLDDLDVEYVMQLEVIKPGTT